MKKQISIVLIAAFAVIASASSAHATTTHWYYIVPGACGISPDGSSSAGSTDFLSGNVGGNYYGNSAPRIITCEMRLPQGASITNARVWGDDPRTGGYAIQWYISYMNYSAPDSVSTSFYGHSANGTKTVWSSATSPAITIDNENNAYLFDLYIAGGVGSITRLIEITYTTP